LFNIVFDKETSMQSAMRYFWHVLMVLFFLALSPAITFGQTSGTLDGTVVDENNNPLADAVVTATNESNGIPRTSATNTQGKYRISFLEPGRYTVSAKLDGYTEEAIGDIIIPLNVVTPLTVPPIVLKPLGSTQPTQPTVPTPTAGPADVGSNNPTLVNLVDAANRGNYNSDILQALPLAGIRSFDFFALLTPGVLPPPATGGAAGPGLGPGVGTSGQFAVNGRRARSNNFTIDGSDNNDQDIGVRRQGFVSLVPQSIESVNEFQISTQLWDAEGGRNFGSQVNAVSRSGGNDIHGIFYGFLTNDRLNARNFFDLSGGPSGGKDSFTRSQVGFVIGGPIVRNKTHYFASFERQDLNATQEHHFAVPDNSNRGFNGGPFLNDIGKAIFPILPRPNNIRGPYGINNFTQLLPATLNGTVFSIKLTHKIGNSVLTGRYNFTDDDSIIPAVGGAINATLGTDTRTQNLSLFYDSTVSNNSFNQIRVSYGRTTLAFPPQPGSPLLFGETRETLNLGLLASDIRDFPRSDAYLRPLQTSFGTFGPFGRTGPIGQLVITPFSPVGIDPFTFPQGRTNNTFQIADTFTKTIGNHSLKLGADIKRNQLNSFLDRNFRPQLIFNGGQFNTASGSRLLLGSDTAAVGVASQLLQTLALTPDTTIGLRFTEYNFFAQDNWRINSRVTLDYGLRYEFSSVPTEANNRIEDTFNFQFPTPDPNIARSRVGRQFQPLFETALKNSVNAFNQFLDGRDKIYRSDRNNFSPRVGVAIDLTGKGKTVLRLGYGLYYDQIIGSVTSQSRNVFPSFLPLVFDTGSPRFGGLGTYDQFGRVIGVPSSFVDNISLTDIGFIFNVIQPGTLNTFGASGGFLSYGLGELLLFSGFKNPDIPIGGGLAFVLPSADFRTPYSQHWNAVVEHQFGKDFVASAAYVGSTGTKLIRFNTPNGGANSFTVLVVNTSLPGNLLEPTPIVPNRQFPDLGPFTVIDSSASSNYHSLQLSLNKRFSYGLQFGSSYTFSHAIDEVSDVFDLQGAFALPQNVNNPGAERASAGFDVRHRSVTHFSYDAPFFKSSKLLGGWQFAGVATLQTGQPFTVNIAFDVNRDGNLTDRLGTDSVVKQLDNGVQRLSVPNLPLRTQIQALSAMLGTDGAVGRNTFRAAGIASFDLAVVKKFQFTEKQNLIVRAEFFNLFNRTHFGIPVRIAGAPAFGRSVSTSLPARLIQFGLKYSF
jgi:hypothetical protein